MTLDSIQIEFFFTNVILSSDQGIRKRWMQGFLPKKSPSIFSCLDLILWPNVSNIFGDDFVPHHLVFYEIF